MAELRTTQVIAEVELGPELRTTQVVAEVELDLNFRTTSISQFLLEIDFGLSAGVSRLSQFMLEIDSDFTPVLPASVSQFLIEIDDTGVDTTKTQDDFNLQALVVDPTTTSSFFTLAAKVKPTSKHSGVFNLQAYVEEATKEFYLAAKVRKEIPTVTEYYPDFEGPYEVRLLDHDLSLVRVLERFERLDFTRAVNGKNYNGYGSFTYTAAADLTNIDEFTLDRIIEVRRMSTTYGAVPVFQGLVRFKNITINEDDHKKLFICAGPDLRHFMKRHIIIPDEDQAFLSLSEPFVDIMHDIVFRNCSVYTAGTRQMPGIFPGTFSGYGIPLNLNFRYSKVSDELDNLANVAEGADWDVFIYNSAPDYITFETFYPFKGRDRRTNTVQGWPEMVWSLDRANIVGPSYTEDRVDEVTVTYVAGEGVGVERAIVERYNVADRQNDSPWNRVEEFIDASSETSEAVLKAQGDANNVEHGMVRTFSVQAAQKELLSYGTKWNLGDITTGVFDLGGTFDMRVVEVREILDPGEGHIAVYPTFFIYPRLEDY